MRCALALALVVASLAACGSDPNPPAQQCQRQCAGRRCGDDGCGGSCGTCAAGSSCSTEGICSAVCTRSCTGRVCGPDGCGGSCGACAAGTDCDAAGACVAGCKADCGGRQCGLDGCGGSCGACAAGTSCDPAGHCVPGCQRQCSGKDCGPDGCGGLCGSCRLGTACGAAGTCEPQQISINCPAGQQCQVFERISYSYTCTLLPDDTADCQRGDVIGYFATFKTCCDGCQGGNSTCGQQFGRWDADVAACEACRTNCQDGYWIACPQEVPGTCLYTSKWDVLPIGCTCQ